MLIGVGISTQGRLEQLNPTLPPTPVNGGLLGEDIFNSSGDGWILEEGWSISNNRLKHDGVSRPGAQFAIRILPAPLEDSVEYVATSTVSPENSQTLGYVLVDGVATQLVVSSSMNISENFTCSGAPDRFRLVNITEDSPIEITQLSITPGDS